MKSAPAPYDPVIDWLLDTDASIRWQVMRDLTDTPAEVVAAERARVASEGWGPRLLDRQETTYKPKPRYRQVLAQRGLSRFGRRPQGGNDGDHGLSAT